MPVENAGRARSARSVYCVGVALIYWGIDEAGYGPMLGPLCVSASVFRVEGWAAGDGAPDLWAVLDKGVCRAVRGARGRVPVADSKKLKLSNQLKTKHPLTHLERGVLSFLGAAGQEAWDEAGLCERVGARLEGAAWYVGGAPELPVSTSADQIRIASNVVRSAMVESGVELLGIRCLTICEGRFNEVLRARGSKAAVVGDAVVALMRSALEKFGGEGAGVRLVCDRQSGRTDYSNMVRAVLGDGFETLEQSSRASRYVAGDRDVGVLFLPEAEDGHLPVALASMTAKYIRELAMARFNRYWSARAPELKPTAGYVTDARRWLRDSEGVVSGDERAMMVRKA